jgi:hypothetical protein
LGKNDIYLDAVPLPGSSTSVQSISDPPVISSDSSQPGQEKLLCRAVTEFQSKIRDETDHIDNVLRALRQYYADVKTRRHLV